MGRIKWKKLRWMYKLSIILGLISFFITLIFSDCLGWYSSCNLSSISFYTLLTITAPSVIVWDVFLSNLYLSSSLEVFLMGIINLIFFGIIGFVIGLIIDLNKK